MPVAPGERATDPKSFQQKQPSAAGVISLCEIAKSTCLNLNIISMRNLLAAVLLLAWGTLQADILTVLPEQKRKQHTFPP
jgi:hypothetical protein